MTEQSPIQSPCRKLCAIDPATSLCMGCYRTLPEIGIWTRLSPEERSSIMAALPERKAANKDKFAIKID
ncbi:MAG: DUF1289 domain-containing protein [Pseudomonadota bacterium]